MSAYLVDDCVVDYVLSAFIKLSKPYAPEIVVPQPEGGYRVFDLAAEDGRNALGQEIINENYASLAHRYGDNDEPHQYKFRAHGKVAMPNNPLPVIVQAIKAIDNIDYQSCEHPGWRKSVAREALVAIKDRLCGRLPGYDDADWGAPDHVAKAEAGPVRIV